MNKECMNNKSKKLVDKLVVSKMIEAIESNNLEQVKIFVQQGIDLNQISSSMDTYLHIACSKGNIGV